MEIILMILAATYMVGGKHNKDTSLAAYRAGKEPPGLVKARLRHEAGGGRFITRPGKDKKPKGPGATRLLIASRWSVACEKAKTKNEDKLQRWRAWYEEQAPNRDQAWRDKQRNKMDRRAARLDRWQGRWTATKDAAKNAVSRRGDGDEDTDVASEQQPDAVSAGNNTPEQPAAGQQPNKTDEPLKIQFPTVDAAEGLKNSPQRPWPERPSAAESARVLTDANQAAKEAKEANATTNTSNGTGDIVDYEQAATALRAAAERVEQYRVDLSAMADGLGGKKWGEEVHGPIRDMDRDLVEIAATYRDLAHQMQQEGDNVSDAEDAHPYVPGQEVVNA